MKPIKPMEQLISEARKSEQDGRVLFDFETDTETITISIPDREHSSLFQDRYGPLWIARHYASRLHLILELYAQKELKIETFR
jgi:hypothetical protein